MTQKCTHPTVRAAVLEGKEWVDEECAVAHYFEDGSIKPACWCCPDCGTRVSYDERLRIAMMKRLR